MTMGKLWRLGALVFCAVSLIVLGDTAGKAVTAQGMAPLFVAWTRFAVAAVLFLPFSGLMRSELSQLIHPRVILRGALVTCGISCILTALKTEPIANVFGAFFVGPVISYALAVMILGERPSPGRSLLLGIGFLGVMLVVKPGFGATAGMGFALMAGVFYGAFLASTRAIAGHYRPRFLLLSQLLTGAILLSPFALSGPLPAATLPLGGLILLSALGSAAGNYLIVVANRRADASLIAPLIYTQLIAATLAGILVFKEWPDAVALTGLVVILASGFGSLWLGRHAVKQH